MKERQANFFRAPYSDPLRSIIAEVLNEFQNYETFFKLRNRKRKAVDQATLEATISAVICDLTHCYLTEPGGAVFVSLSNQSLGRRWRYRSKAENKKLSDILSILSSPELNFIVMEKGKKAELPDEQNQPIVKARRTTLRAAERLVRRIQNHNISLADLTFSDEEEIIILKDKKKDSWINGQLVSSAELLNYNDNPIADRYRAELREINSWLRSADIQTLPQYNHRDVRLQRFFNNSSFEIGGRLFGGFWQSGMKAADRHHSILIDNEPIVVLDYGQMGVRLAYSHVGATPPNGDLYSIPNPIAANRAGIKLLLSAAFFAESPQTRFPQGSRKYFHPKIKYEDVIRAVLNHHPALRGVVYKGLGHRFMFMESQILVALLLELKRQGIVALPIHDAVIVSKKAKDAASLAMKNIFYRMTGLEAGINVE